MAQPVHDHVIEWSDEPRPPAVPPERRLALARAAIANNPASAQLHLQLGLALAASGAHDQAERALAEAARLDPESAAARRALTRARVAVIFDTAQQAVREGRAADAVGGFERVLEFEPSHYAALHALVSLLHAQGRLDAAAHACDVSLLRAPGNTPALALKAQVLEAAGRIEAASALLDVERLVQTRMLEWPPLEPPFHEALLETVRRNRAMEYEPERRTARLGYRGRLDPDASEAASRLRMRLREEVERYRASVLTDRTHPFAAAAPARAMLGMWGLVLHEGGHVVPHIHPAGWVSGVYYVDVAGTDGAGGELELGGGGPFGEATAAPLKRIRPVPGLLVLFPSFLFHRTVPTRVPAERVCVAFDVVPTN